MSASWRATIDYAPAFSPDGTRIAFTGQRKGGDGHTEIYVMNTDGTNRTNLTVHPAHDSQPAFSPEGNRIAFASFRDGIHEFHVMNGRRHRPHQPHN